MNWVAPDTARMMEAVDRTWSAAEFRTCGPFTLRRGADGGKRVSAASLSGDFTETNIRAAEAEMLAMGQPKLFQLYGDGGLDAWLDTDGYRKFDEVTLYAIPAAEMTGDMVDRPVEPTPTLAQFWAAQGIGEGRLDVMRRVSGPKICLTMGNVQAAAFVAADRDMALVHALEVSPIHRRQGIGRQMMQGAAAWAVAQGVETLGLVVLSHNTGARALYKALGMTECGAYHYRIKED